MTVGSCFLNADGQDDVAVLWTIEEDGETRSSLFWPRLVLQLVWEMFGDFRIFARKAEEVSAFNFMVSLGYFRGQPQRSIKRLM